METINITQPHERNDWYIATMTMLSGKIYQGYGTTKVKAIEDLKINFNK